MGPLLGAGRMNEHHTLDSSLEVDAAEASVYFAVAPFVEGMKLDESQFRPITTSNLSMTGMGFFSQRQIRESEVAIVMRTNAMKPIFVRAKIIHCTPSAFGAEQGFIVGCHFVERLSNEAERRQDSNSYGLDLNLIGPLAEESESPEDA